MTDQRELIQIPGLSQPYMRVPGHYNYDGDKCLCPSCGGLGMPWGGWFACDGAADCQAIALVDGGETFRPARLVQPQAHEEPS